MNTSNLNNGALIVPLSDYCKDHVTLSTMLDILNRHLPSSALEQCLQNKWHALYPSVYKKRITDVIKVRLLLATATAAAVKKANLLTMLHDSVNFTILEDRLKKCKIVYRLDALTNLPRSMVNNIATWHQLPDDFSTHLLHACDERGWLNITCFTLLYDLHQLTIRHTSDDVKRMCHFIQVSNIDQPCIRECHAIAIIKNYSASLIAHVVHYLWWIIIWHTPEQRTIFFPTMRAILETCPQYHIATIADILKRCIHMPNSAQQHMPNVIDWFVPIMSLLTTLLADEDLNRSSNIDLFISLYNIINVYPLDDYDLLQNIIMRMDVISCDNLHACFSTIVYFLNKKKWYVSPLPNVTLKHQFLVYVSEHVSRSLCIDTLDDWLVFSLINKNTATWTPAMYEEKCHHHEHYALHCLAAYQRPSLEHHTYVQWCDIIAATHSFNDQWYDIIDHLEFLTYETIAWLKKWYEWTADLHKSIKFSDDIHRLNLFVKTHDILTLPSPHHAYTIIFKDYFHHHTARQWPFKKYAQLLSWLNTPHVLLPHPLFLNIRRLLCTDPHETYYRLECLTTIPHASRPSLPTDDVCLQNIQNTLQFLPPLEITNILWVGLYVACYYPAIMLQLFDAIIRPTEYKLQPMVNNNDQDVWQIALHYRSTIDVMLTYVDVTVAQQVNMIIFFQTWLLLFNSSANVQIINKALLKPYLNNTIQILLDTHNNSELATTSADILNLRLKWYLLLCWLPMTTRVMQKWLIGLDTSIKNLPSAQQYHWLDGITQWLMQALRCYPQCVQHFITISPVNTGTVQDYYECHPLK
jgi:hypothetical protein